MFLSEKISRKLSEYLFHLGLITESQVSYYTYIYCWGIDYLLYFLSMILIGILMKKTIPSIVFCLTVSSFRFTSGGTHASTRNICSFISYLFFVVVMIIFPFFPSELFSFSKLLILFLLALVIFLAPIDNPKKRFSQKQKKRLKVFTIIVCILVYATLVLFNYFQKYDYCNIIILCVIFLLLDLLVGYIRNKRGKLDVF